MTPLEAEQRKVAELTALLREARDFLNALWLDCTTAGIAESTLTKYKGLGARINKYTKNRTADSKEHTA